MIAPLLAKIFDLDVATLTIRSLAVVGAAVLGGLSVSGMTGMFVRMVSAKKMPPKVRWGVRSLGGLVVGWIVALFLFGGGGGWGLGGLGGMGLGGSGAGQGDTKAPEIEAAKTKDSGNPLSSPSTELRIEVLGDPALRRLGDGKFEPTHCYRIDGGEPPRLRTLAELKQLINQRLGQNPALKRVEIVLYTDSPGRKVNRVSELERWLDDLVASKKDQGFVYSVNDKVPTEAPVR